MVHTILISMGCYTLTLLYCRVTWAWEEHRVQAQFRTRKDGRNLIFPPTVALRGLLHSRGSGLVEGKQWFLVFLLMESQECQPLCWAHLSLKPFPGLQKSWPGHLRSKGKPGEGVHSETYRFLWKSHKAWEHSDQEHPSAAWATSKE